jgi:hypothetical protein
MNSGLLTRRSARFKCPRGSETAQLRTITHGLPATRRPFGHVLSPGKSCLGALSKLGAIGKRLRRLHSRPKILEMSCCGPGQVLEFRCRLATIGSGHVRPSQSSSTSAARAPRRSPACAREGNRSSTAHRRARSSWAGRSAARSSRSFGRTVQRRHRDRRWRRRCGVGRRRPELWSSETITVVAAEGGRLPR